MKISYNWLKSFVDIDISAEELAESLSLVGFEVDSVDADTVDFEHVVIGKVLTKEKHPDADRLSICSVDVAEDKLLTIICGAPNVDAGQTVIVAKVGAFLPIGLKIKKAKIRGVSSQGMICSKEELALTDKSEGIWVLSDDLKAGMPLAKALNYETDYILDVGVTPNRPDALSHIGIAREVAAILDKPLKLEKITYPTSSEKCSDAISIEIECPETCPRYAATLIRNIKLGDSPEWMQRRLNAAGVRAINNVVDITNYVMLETGQPLHAFDYDLIEGQKIVVRESKSGEKFTTLDDKTHTLKDDVILICDNRKPIALGGIMGGLNSEVGNSTKHILLESAYFHPESIQKALRDLGMNSEASMRFERGVDPNGNLRAQALATKLLVEYAGGEAAEGFVDVYPKPIEKKVIPLNTKKINQLLGTSLSDAEMTKLLAKIEIEVQGSTVIAPTFRPDLTRIADVAEEVARLFGYDNIKMETHTQLTYQTLPNPFDEYIDEMRTELTGNGFQEILTNSLVNAQMYEKMTGQQIYTMLNPLNNDLNGLRNSLIPGMLAVIQYNNYRQRRNLSIFEISKIFLHPGSLNERPKEEIHLTIGLTGERHGDAWYSEKNGFDFFDIKGIVEHLADKFSLDKLSFIPYDGTFTEIQSVEIRVDNQSIGFLGRLNTKLQKKYDIEAPVWIANLNITDIYDVKKSSNKIKDLPKYPFTERDFAMICNASEKVENILKTVKNNGGKFLKNAHVFDVYEGKQIEQGKKSIAIRMLFQSADRTLTDEEVNPAFQNIMKSVEKKHEATLRN